LFAPYEPRPLAFLGVQTVAGHKLKVYSIRLPGEPHDPERFVGGWKLAADALPLPAAAPERPGVGFAILHQGRTGDYLILSWWDRENELPTRVFLNTSEGWRPATGGESFCIWDLRVVWWEREAYVGTVLAGRADGLERYLAHSIDGFA
jgi:hypothetical protein